MQRVPRPRRLLAVLFLDMVGSTQTASDLGDRRWRELLSRFRRTIRGQLKRFEGHEEDTAGDGFFATFGSPEQAVRAADAIVRSVQAHGVDVRCGVHFGEAEMVDGKLAGIAVHIGSRVMSLAGPGEVLVTSTVRDLVTGSGMTFEDLSAHELKGVPGTWQLFALRAIDDRPAAVALTGAEAAERLAAVVPPGTARRRAPLLVGSAAAAAVGVVLWVLLGTGGGRAGAVRTTTPHGGPSTSAGPSSPTPPPLVHEAVVRLDPGDGKVRVVATNVTHGGLGSNRFVAFGENGLWVSGNGLVHVDPRSGATRDIPTGGGNVTVGDNQVWVATATGSQNKFHPAAAEVDPATFHVLRVVQFPGTFLNVLSKVAVADGYVWLVYQDRLIRADAAHHTFTEVPHQGGVDFVSAYGTEVWATDFLNGVLRRIDPQRARVDRTVRLQVAPDAVSLGPAGLWVANIAGRIAFPVDETSGAVGTPVSVGSGPVGIAVGTHAVWVANRDDDTVTRIDVESQASTTFPVPGRPVAIAVDPRTDAPWVYLG